MIDKANSCSFGGTVDLVGTAADWLGWAKNRDWDKIDAMYDTYDKIKIDYPYGQFIPNVEEIQSSISNIGEIHSSYMKQIAFGKYNGTAEEIVAEYQESLKAAGIEEVTAELQRQMDELYK